MFRPVRDNEKGAASVRDHRAAADDKSDFYAELREQLGALLSGESDPIANAGNTSSLLFHAIPDVNWVGFYFLQSERELVLGPFQGKPACVRIAIGRGVCGAAVERGASVLVEDVHAFRRSEHPPSRRCG